MRPCAWVFILLLLLAWTRASDAQQSDSAVLSAPDAAWAERLSALLFPETETWRHVEALPAPTPVATRLSFMLATAYADKDGACPALGLFLSPEATKRMHAADIGQTGHPDLLYSGPSGCTDSDITVVWRDYQSAGSRPDKVVSRAGLALRLDAGPTPRLLMLISGCCADPMNRFAVMEPVSGRIHRAVSVPNTLVLPTAMIAAPGDITFSGDLVLRSAPVEDDAYDENASHFRETAVFGTVIRKFLPGVTAHGVAAYTDPAGRRFALVWLDRETASKAYYTVFPSQVGWVRLP